MKNYARISFVIAISALLVLSIQNAFFISPARQIFENDPAGFEFMGMVEKAVNTGGLRISSYSLILSFVGLIFGIIGTHSKQSGALNALLWNFILMICSFVPFYVLFL